MKTECSSTQQIGQDLSHSYQTLLCVQWAYLLTVLVDFEPFSFFPLLILYLQTLHVKSDCSVLNLCGVEKGCESDRGQAITVHRHPHAR